MKMFVLIVLASILIESFIVDAGRTTVPCLADLLDISATAEVNASLWEYRRVANPDWNGKGPVVPLFVAFPKDAEDVRRCLQCAVKEGLQVAVKGGGHSFGGYSTIPAEKGFMINMRFMATASSVVERGEGQTASVTVQAGARWRDVYSSFKVSGKEWVVTGGLCPTVGVTGFTLGGGVGPAVRLYGMAIDNVESFRMVTSKGERVVSASPTSYSELFWALRGSGGGNLGIVTDMTFTVHPGPDLYSFGEVCFPLSKTSRLLAAVQKVAPSLPRTINVDIVINSDPIETGACLWIVTMEPLNTTRAALSPLLAYMLPAKPAKDTLREKNCWWEGIVDFGKKHGYSEFSDSPYFMKNCLIDSITPELAATLVNLTASKPDSCDGQHFIAFGGKVGEVAPQASVFPWQSTEYMIYTSCGYDQNNATSQTEAASFLQRWENAVYPHCNGGSYVNFIDTLATNDVAARRYYGSNLERLQEVKRQWNPSVSPLHFPKEVPEGQFQQADIYVA